ncbi:MAG: AAA family ATPase [Eubacteriales bacterium]|nr:AAA family ATPase [Eubacteriales bacterium]
MKIAVTGKGGVGKTTLSSTLSYLYAQESKNVLAVDVDPDANLGLALGFTEEELDSIIPITKMKKLINERTGVDDMGQMFKLNPKVDDIPDKYAKEKNGVRLLLLGTVDTAGRGCVCPENVMLKRLISHLILRSDDIVILDMEAGLEHLARGTTEGMDQFIVVIEPGARSVQTYNNVKRLAAELGITEVNVVANKIRDEKDEEFIRSRIPEENLLGFIHVDPDVQDADRQGLAPFECSAKLREEVSIIKERIDRKSGLNHVEV